MSPKPYCANLNGSGRSFARNQGFQIAMAYATASSTCDVRKLPDELPLRHVPVLYGERAEALRNQDAFVRPERSFEIGREGEPVRDRRQKDEVGAADLERLAARDLNDFVRELERAGSLVKAKRGAFIRIPLEDFEDFRGVLGVDDGKKARIRGWDAAHGALRDTDERDDPGFVPQLPQIRCRGNRLVLADDGFRLRGGDARKQQDQRRECPSQHQCEILARSQSVGISAASAAKRPVI